MRLSNFLQLISDLDQKYCLYFKENKKADTTLPIIKIKLEASTCVLILGTSAQPAKSIASFITLTKNIRQKGIPLMVKNKVNITIFGIQINPSSGKIYLM